MLVAEQAGRNSDVTLPDFIVSGIRFKRLHDWRAPLYQR